MHTLRKHYTFLSRYKYVIILGSILGGVAFLFSTQPQRELPLNHFILPYQKDLCKVFLDGEYLDYLEFIQNQRTSKKLDWKQFQEIHELGKSVSKILESVEAKEDILEGVLIFQISRTAGIEECFYKLKESSLLQKEDLIFKAAFFSFLVETGKSLPESLNKEGYLDLLRIKKACLLLKKQSVKEAFSYYKRKLSNLLELDMESVLDRYLLKVALQKRIYSKEEIETEKKALLQLTFDKLQQIIHDEHVVVDLL